MIKLLDILENKILVPRRSPEERSKNYNIALQKKVQQYIKDGSKGDLDLNGTLITSLPDNLKVGGDLNLGYSPLTSLPNNLQVKKNLFLYNTKISSLPDNLKVGKSLSLHNTKISSLPNSLQVGGFLDLRKTPISKSKKYTEEQIRQMVDVKGEIYI
jgi:hypothetical protein